MTQDVAEILISHAGARSIKYIRSLLVGQTAVWPTQPNFWVGCLAHSAAPHGSTLQISMLTPSEVTSTQSLHSFLRHLKTFLF